MTIFWLVVGLFVLGALLMLLPGLLMPRADTTLAASTAAANVAVHRDHLREAERDLEAGLLAHEQAEEARVEIRHRVLDDVAGADGHAQALPARGTALMLALLLPAASVLTYLQLGSPTAVAPQPVVRPVAAAAASAGARHGVTPEQIQQMATALAERLQHEPDNAEGWLMLARSYTALQRYRDAVVAFKRAQVLLPGDAGVLADLADVTGMAQGKRLAGEPARLVQQALDADPRHPKALALAGSVAFEARDYAAARSYWERLSAVVPADSPPGRAAQRNLADAARLEGGLQTVADNTPAAPNAPAAAATRISGQVVIDKDLATRLAEGDTLFVFARAAQGPRMPLAVLRKPAQGLPLDFVLDDSMAMAPNLKLSNFAQVVIGARISKSGSATPQAGDLVGLSAAVSPGASGVRVLVDSVQP